MSECYVGEIRIFGGNFAPVGWALCDGSLLSIAENEILYALLGTTYGGDGETKFALPDLRGRTPLNQGINPSTGTNYSIGQQLGFETVTLTSQQLPVHTHVMTANSKTGDSPTPTNHVWGLSDTGKQYVASDPNGTMNPASITPVGGNQPHNNLMPLLTVNFIISLYGVYPQQS